MGSKFSKKQESDLVFVENSNEAWIFGENHIAAIDEFAPSQIVTEIIMSYIQITDLTWEWDHSNYTSFVHRDANQNLLPTIWRSRNIAFVGGSGSGKSSLAKRVCVDRFPAESNDRMDSWWPLRTRIDLTQNKKMALDICGICGVEGYNNRYALMPSRIAREIQIWLLVFDVSDKRSFEAIHGWKKEIEKQIGGGKIFTMIAVGTKCDLRVDENFELMQNAVDLNEVIQWCKENDIAYVETSAKNGKNVDYLLKQCVYEYLLKERQLMQSENVAVVESATSYRVLPSKIKQ